MKALRSCPRCEETPERSSIPSCSAIPDPDDTTFFLTCRCDEDDAQVSGDSPAACEAAWDARCDDVHGWMGEAQDEAFASAFYGGDAPGLER